jgi:hypothetical protein
MSDWLDPVVNRLDDASRPAAVFFRDDDGGWDDERLNALLDAFETQRQPIDVALIPMALSDTLAAGLKRRCERHPRLLGLHQHGFRHVNHESDGRKCEFGPGRSTVDLRKDIKEGRERLRAMLGERIDPFFTPPWNRCTQATVDCLDELGFVLLSRDAGAQPLHLRRLKQAPVHLDWCRLRRQPDFDWEEMGRAIASRLSAGRPTGIMLHHAVMDAEDRSRIEGLLALLASHDRAECRLIRELEGYL